MKLLFSEQNSDYGRYQYSYAIWAVPEPGEAPARIFAYQNPEAFQLLIDKLVDASIVYLSRQIETGVEAVQIFDSWAGVLPAAEFEAIRRHVGNETAMALAETVIREDQSLQIAFDEGLAVFEDKQANPESIVEMYDLYARKE